jgi:hypothetical protein
MGGQRRRAHRRETGRAVEGAGQDLQDFGSNAAMQDAMLASQGPGGTAGFDFSEGEDGLTEEGGQAFSFSEEEGEENEIRADREEEERRIAQQRIDDLQRSWQTYSETIASEVTEARGHADAAQDAVATGEPEAYDGSVAAFEKALQKQAPALLKAIEEAYRAGFVTEADSSGLQQTREAIVSMVHRQLPPGLGLLFVANEYRGQRSTHRFTTQVPVEPPARATTPGELVDELAGWVEVAGTWSKEVSPFLDAAPTSRAFGESFPEEAPRPGGPRNVLDDPVVEELDRLWFEGPNTSWRGRARQYLDAVLQDALPERLADSVDPDRIQTKDEIQLQDRVGPEGELDFDKLDGILRTIDSELNDTYLDDDIVMDALKKAESPEERDYIMNRLFNTNHDGDLKITALKSRLTDDWHRVFEAWRAGAGQHAGGSGDWGRKPSMMDAAGDATRLLPAATTATVSGMVSSIPIAGDYYDDTIGKDVLAWGQGMSVQAGADAESAAMASSIANFTGKLAGTIGQGRLTGQAGKLLGAAGKAGGAGFSALSGAQKAKVAAGTTLQVADVANNLVQSFGYKVTGEEIGGGEQGAAMLGLLTGGLDLKGMTEAYKGAKAIDAAGDASRAARGVDLDGPKGVGRILREEGRDVGINAATSVAQGAGKAYDAQQKVEGVEAAVADKSDAEVLDALRDLPAGHARQEDAAAAIHEATVQGDHGPARRLLVEIEMLKEKTGRAEAYTETALNVVSGVAG